MKTQTQNKMINQRGVSLVELMVAMVLGLIMTAAVMQTYLSTKQTYNLTNGISRLQENARFGHYFITKDLREAGNRGCFTNIRNMLRVHPPSDYLAFLKPVSGWEFTGTGRDDSYTIATTLTTPASTSWAGDGAAPSFLIGNAIAGSDILSFKSYDALDVVIKDGVNNYRSSSIGTTDAHKIAGDSILLLGDCLQADLFQHTGQGRNSSALTAARRNRSVPGNTRLTNDVWSKDHDSKSKIYSLITTYYFVQQGASGLPSLFRLRTSVIPQAGEDIDDSGKEELVEGVESLQVYYGVDTDSDNVPNLYLSADLLTATQWDNVVSVRVGLLFQSNTNATDVDQATNYTLLDNITLTHAAIDNTLRYAVNSTVKLRNRGLTTDMSSGLVCKAPDGC